MISVLLAVNNGGTFFANELFRQRILGALAQTMGQVTIACLIGVLIGLPIGLAVWATSPVGIRPQRLIFRVTSVIVDLGRAIPFIVLMLLLIGFTRLVTGSIIGWQAGIPPLAVGCIPFFARLAENAFRTVEQGKVEAALMAGASRWRVAWGITAREAAPGLVAAATVTYITLIGYSMITGTIGAGGLGDLVYNVGYTRNQHDIFVMVVVVVVVLVELIQLAGDLVVRRLDHTR
ncbi:MAG: ABC transporter permease [Micrococcales bacterium]|nr:ABC transporter permease [Micrococcales bacterium]